MERYDIERLRATDIEEVAERLGLSVKRHACLCCFHDDHHPSMTLNRKTNTFRCWSCGAHGDGITLAMHVLNKSFKEACEWLGGGQMLSQTAPRPAAQRPVQPFDPLRYARVFEHPCLDETAKKFLFEERRLDGRVVDFCRLNSYREWLQIPYYGTDGRTLLGVQSRYMGHDPKQPRFRFASGLQPPLYNLPVLSRLRVGEPLFLAEGPSDVWALLSSGRKAIGVPSATMFKDSYMDFLAPLRLMQTPLHVVPDRDRAGEALYERLLEVANHLGLCLHRHNLPEGCCKDFSDYWRLRAEGVTCYP